MVSASMHTGEKFLTKEMYHNAASYNKNTVTMNKKSVIRTSYYKKREESTGGGQCNT